MNLEQLEAIQAVAETGGFRAAGEKLRRSQPAISATIKQLEEEFSIQIFDRSAYRPILTEAGAAFLNVAKATLNSARYTERVAKELGQKGAETRLCISVDPLLSVKSFGLVVDECNRSLLPVNLVVDKSILNGSHKPLLEGMIDLAFAPFPSDAEGVEAIPLENVILVGAMAKSLVKNLKKPDKLLLEKTPQIIVYDRRFDEQPDELIANTINKKTGSLIFVPDHFSKLKLIAGGVGWGRISKDECGANSELIQINRSLCRPLELELCLLRPRNRPIGVTARAIWSLFEKRGHQLK